MTSVAATGPMCASPLCMLAAATLLLKTRSFRRPQHAHSLPRGVLKVHGAVRDRALLIPRPVVAAHRQGRLHNEFPAAAAAAAAPAPARASLVVARAAAHGPQGGGHRRRRRAGDVPAALVARDARSVARLGVLVVVTAALVVGPALAPLLRLLALRLVLEDKRLDGPRCVGEKRARNGGGFRRRGGLQRALTVGAAQ